MEAFVESVLLDIKLIATMFVYKEFVIHLVLLDIVKKTMIQRNYSFLSNFKK